MRAASPARFQYDGLQLNAAADSKGAAPSCLRFHPVPNFQHVLVFCSQTPLLLHLLCQRRQQHGQRQQRRQLGRTSRHGGKCVSLESAHSCCELACRQVFEFSPATALTTSQSQQGCAPACHSLWLSLPWILSGFSRKRTSSRPRFSRSRSVGPASVCCRDSSAACSLLRRTRSASCGRRAPPRLAQTG